MALWTAFLLSPAVLRAETEARFTLGLTGEALSERQEIGATPSTQSSLGGTVLLGVDGGIVDRRFLSFGGFAQYNSFKLTSSGADERSLADTQWTYAGNVRAFSNRMFTLGGNILHATNSPTGGSLGTIVGGVQDTRGAEAAFRAAGFPELEYVFKDSQFRADDPEALRDEKQRLHQLKAMASYGTVQAALDIRKEDLDLFSGLLRQDLRYGVFNFNINRGGTNSWETVINGNRLQTAARGGDYSDPTTVLVAQNTFRHRFASATYFDLGYSHQYSADPARRLNADLGSATVYYEISKPILLDAQLAYLSQDDTFAQTGRIHQPSAALGARWGKSVSSWSFVIYPRGIYSSTSAPQRQTESGLGGQLVLSAQKAFRGGSSLLFDVDGLYNRLTIATLDPANGMAGGSFLSGLEKSHYRGRLTWSQGLGGSARLYLLGEAERRIRFYVDTDITESVFRGTLRLQWGPFAVGGSASRIRSISGDVPSDTTVTDGSLTWYPLNWLGIDALAQSEDRTALGTSGRFQSVEGGVRLLYARISFFARVRETLSSAEGSQDRRDRRVWAGVQRTFDFGLGSGTEDGKVSRRR